MLSNLLRILLSGALLSLIGSQTACTSLSKNARVSTERREQANDAMAGGVSMAAGVFRATVVAAVRQPVTTFKTGIASLWNRPGLLVSGLLPIHQVADSQPEEVPGTWQFERMLDQKKYPQLQAGTLKFLVDGRSFYPELDRQIKGARSSIDVQVFIFDNDDIGVRYAAALKRRSNEVSVKVLFDDLGSSFAFSAAPETRGPAGFVPPPDMHNYLRQDSNVRVRRILNPWLACDHTKLLVFDQRTALLGGMNIGREYFSEWHDLMVRVEGPVVQSLADDFKRSWRKAGPLGDLALLAKPMIFSRRKAPVVGPSMRVLRTDPAEGRYEILDSNLLAIRAARKRIWIETPYFAHDGLVAAVAAAAKRGVDVRVIIPAKGDSGLMDAGNLATAAELIQAGVKFYRYPRMTHMKVMVCDHWVSLGSANFDSLSMRINRELNVTFSDPATIRELESMVFKKDFAASKVMRLSETQSPTSAITELVADQF